MCPISKIAKSGKSLVLRTMVFRKTHYALSTTIKKILEFKFTFIISELNGPPCMISPVYTTYRSLPVVLGA